MSPFCLGITGSASTVEAAYDAGINFFFLSADMHWPLYQHLRDGLAALLRRGGDVRDRIVVAGTSYVSPSVFLSMPFVELVESVPGLGRLDVCVAGGCFVDDPPARRQRMRDHRDARFQGARACGASFHDRALVAPACNAEEIDVGFVRYNPGHVGARLDVFPALARSSTLLYGFKSMSGWVTPREAARIADLPPGTWLPAPSDLYRFALSNPWIDGLLCAPQTPAEVEALAGAMEKGPLDDEEQEHMIDLFLLAKGRAAILAGDGASAR